MSDLDGEAGALRKDDAAIWEPTFQQFLDYCVKHGIGVSIEPKEDRE